MNVEKIVRELIKKSSDILYKKIKKLKIIFNEE